MPREVRPEGDDYYETKRVELMSQGDIFSDVPLLYPGVGVGVIEVAGSRHFLSGPLEPGFAMLITPTCSIHAQGSPGYSHVVLTLVPVLSVEHLMHSTL